MRSLAGGGAWAADVSTAAGCVSGGVSSVVSVGDLANKIKNISSPGLIISHMQDNVWAWLTVVGVGQQ